MAWKYSSFLFHFIEIFWYIFIFQGVVSLGVGGGGDKDQDADEEGGEEEEEEEEDEEEEEELNAVNFPMIVNFSSNSLA